MSEIIDDIALLGEDDELDYDLAKDEEDALLADPENFDETYEDEHGEVENDQYQDDAEEVEGNEEDILDIDANVRLDEEDAVGESLQETQETLQDEDVDDEEYEEQKQRNRFNNERSDNQAIHRLTSNEIPDTLEKVPIQPFNTNTNTNTSYQRGGNNNGRFFRGGRGRGGGNHRGGRNFNNNNPRTSVFGRVGNFVPTMENKKVLINPHFRGNVQVNENARLVWDSNQQHPRFANNNPVIPVAPFQAQIQPQVQQQPQPSPWVVPPYNESNNGFNYQDYNPMGQQQQQHQFVGQNQNQNMTNWSEDATYNSEHIYQNQGQFRGRQQLMNNQPQRNFIQIPQTPLQQQHHQQQQQQRPPLLNQPNIPPLLPLPQQHQQQYIDNNQFVNQHFNQPPPAPAFHQHPQHQHQQFPLQVPHQQQPLFNQPNNQMYDYNYGYNNYKPPPQHQQQQHPPPPHHGNYAPPVQQPQNFNQFPNVHQYDTPPNINRQFNRPIQRDSQPLKQPQTLQRTISNRGGYNQVNNRTPPKRRPFDQKNLTSHHGGHNQNQAVERDLPKKKRRSMELANLHEVPTVDMPDTTTEDKGEEEDEETKAYRKKIEEQKRLREKILREKEERRRLAALEQQPEQPPPLLQQQQQIKTNLPQKQLKKIVRRPQQQKQQQLPQPQQQEQQQPKRIVMLKQPQPSSSSSSIINRRVVLKGINPKEDSAASTTAISTNDSDKNPFMSNRKVIAAATSAASLGPTIGIDNKSVNFNEKLIETPVVVVSNLAASTTDVKIRSMCQGLGPIQTIEMIPNSRQATITFKNIVSAHKFFKKFQRKIIDLSMIQVTLEALT